MCDQAYNFAIETHPNLVDGLMPCCSMLQIDCKTGVLEYDVDHYDFTAYKRFLEAGIEVIYVLNNFDYALKRVISQLLRIAVAFISFSILLVNFCSSCSFW